MAAIGTAFIQAWGEATGSFVESFTFSLENLPGLDASGVIAMNGMANLLDPSAQSGPPEAWCFLIGWQTDSGFQEADPQFWGAFFGHAVRRVDAGVTCIQALGKWTLTTELWE
jgi:hypothetical protein